MVTHVTRTRIHPLTFARMVTLSPSFTPAQILDPYFVLSCDLIPTFTLRTQGAQRYGAGAEGSRPLGRRGHPGELSSPWVEDRGCSCAIAARGIQRVAV